MTPQPSLDIELQLLGTDIDRQLSRLPKPTAFPPPKPVNPLYYARLLMGLIVLGAAFNFLVSVGSIFVHKSELVVVSLEGGEPKVWKTVSQYESASGKHWIDNLETVHFADYEATTFDDRLQTAARSLIALVAFAFILRAINRAAKQLQIQAQAGFRQGDMKLSA